MPPEILALIDKPWLLAIVLALGATCGIGVERFVEGQKRAERRAYWQGRNSRNTRPARPSRVPTEAEPDRNRGAADQLALVMAAQFASRPLLNRPEVAVFKALDEAVIARAPGWQVMAQVSLGEFLTSRSKEAFFAINSKRVDFALMDSEARVRHVIEYQGTGHHQDGGAAAARDAIKKEALRKAGIGYHEVVAGHTTPADLRRLIDKLLLGYASDT